MTMNSFSPVDIFMMEVKVLDIFLKSWIDICNEHHKRQEANIQQLLLEKSDGMKESDTSRILPRINRISAATRAFLEKNKQLTFFSSIPMVRKIELDMARKFVRSFQSVERTMRHTTLPVPLAQWHSENFRNELSQMASNDDTVYQMLARADTLPKSEHKHIVEQLSQQLMCGHEKSSASRQME